MLDVLLQAKYHGVKITNEEIREEVDTFMYGGHDTTSSCLEFTLLILANMPEIQSRVYNEIIQETGKLSIDEINVNQISNLHYLDRVIRESLRMFPPVPFVSRETFGAIEFGKFFQQENNFSNHSNYLNINFAQKKNKSNLI